uniref:Fucolectin tachylectin-4 pentraxin-1 domain-containing protein n=1 Tax=Gadus morhua TaxID=8049 RepID=A0A8C4ZUC0_GADMO
LLSVDIYIYLCDFGSISRINVALSGTAIQSTTFLGGVAERAIDGNSDPHWEHNSCTHTNSTAKPWWRLELPGVYRVSEIQVTNRNTARERLNGVTSPTITQYCCLTQTVKCLGMEGRFINFYRSSEIILALQLCEVKVYGGRHPVHHDMIV